MKIERGQGKGERVSFSFFLFIVCQHLFISLELLLQPVVKCEQLYAMFTVSALYRQVGISTRSLEEEG